MIQYFIKNGVIRSYNVVDGKVRAMIRILGNWVGNPTLQQLYADGWEDYTPPTPPTPPEPTKEEQYKARVVELIREQYTIDDELSLLRQRTTKITDFATYYDFCEDCKKQAYREIYGTNPPLNL